MQGFIHKFVVFSLSICTLFSIGCVNGLRIGTPQPRPTEPYAGTDPLVVVIERNPWLMVMGSDTPRFVLYDDGTVIYTTEMRKYLTVKLTSEELEAAKKDFLPPDYYMNLRESQFSISSFTDMPTNVFYFSRQEKKKAFSVYGVMKHDRLPSEIADLKGIYERATTYTHPLAQEWVPKYIEVMITPGILPGLPPDWPEGWPTLDDTLTWNRGSGYSIFLPSSKLKELTDYLTKRKKERVHYRYAFPSEPIWLEKEAEIYRNTLQ